MPKVTTIITTHCRPDVLSRAVESARNAGTNVEIIVVDDASSDRTAAICSELRGIRYVRLNRNLGVARARNVGILASSGEYITFHDDDDVRFSGSLDEQVDVLSTHPEFDLVYGQVLLGDSECRPLDARPVPTGCPEGDVFWELLLVNFMPCLSVVFRRQSLLRVGLLEGDLSGIDDWDLWLRIAERGSVGAVPKPIGIWRQATANSGQGSSHLARMHRLAAQALRERWLKLPRALSASPQQRDDVERRLRRRVAEALLSCAGEVVAKRIPAWPRSAYNDFATALKLSPSRTLRLETFKLMLASYVTGSLER